ncbi:MAG TPA: selenium cofactor biosynthesis protein YqeC [Rhodanobacteraceae bacterium]
MNDAELIDVLGARGGIVCAVGAGGKKTTLYRLLRAHPGHVAFTSTVFTRVFPDDLPAVPVVASPDSVVDAALAAARSQRKIAFASPSDKPGRLAGLAPDDVARCHREGRFDATFVKADGARMRLIKAPDTHEPNLVPGTATVLALVSARVIGLPLTSRCAHRPECISAVTGAQDGEALTPLHVARLIASPDGLLRGVGAARVVPIISMAEGARERAAAREAAHIALGLSERYAYVVVAAMRSDPPGVEVVAR